MDKAVPKGSTIKLKWVLDENKVINITLAELNESLEISKNNRLSDEEIKNDIVQTYTVNP